MRKNKRHQRMFNKCYRLSAEIQLFQIVKSAHDFRPISNIELEFCFSLNVIRMKVDTFVEHQQLDVIQIL